MTRTMPPAELTSFERRLLAELTDIVVERRAALGTSVPAPVTARSPRRRAVPRLALGLGAGLAAATAALVVTPGVGLLPSSRQGAIIVASGQSLQVKSYSVDPGGGDRATRAADVAASLRRLGVRVEEVPSPVSPSLVGRVTTVEVPPGEGLRWSSDETDQTLLVDPDVYDGTVVLNVGATARPGERYTTSASAFDKGEVLAGLHCAAGWPMEPRAVGKAAATAGQQVVWQLDTPVGDGRSNVTEHSSAPEGLVSYVSPERPGTVRAVLVPRGAPPAAGAGDPRSSTPCTPALAAPWK